MPHLALNSWKSSVRDAQVSCAISHKPAQSRARRTAFTVHRVNPNPGKPSPRGSVKRPVADCARCRSVQLSRECCPESHVGKPYLLRWQDPIPACLHVVAKLAVADRLLRWRSPRPDVELPTGRCDIRRSTPPKELKQIAASHQAEHADKSASRSSPARAPLVPQIHCLLDSSRRSSMS